MSNTDVSEWTAMLRVLGAAALGGIVGWDRESRHRSSAGIRTHMMVGAGACLFVVTAVLAFAEQAAKARDANIPYFTANPDRILAGIATGVGFLGGGVIIKTNGHIRGLTTAAGLWTVAGVGAAIAYGRWTLGSIIVILTVSIELSDIVLNYLHISRDPFGSAGSSPVASTVEGETLRSPEIVDSSKA
jgi:putative Mg2+ transporter-C (MgtC) family protein